MGLLFYAKPAGELADGNDNGFKVLEAVANKTVLEEGIKPSANQSSYSTTTTWKDGTKTLSYKFYVPANGDYVFEWTATTASNYEGIAISNYWIATDGDLSFASTPEASSSFISASTVLLLLL